MENTTTQVKSKPVKKNYGAIFANLAPYIGLVLITIIFQILTKGRLLTVANIQSLSNQVIITALVAIGAVFVFSLNCFDMSLGSGVLLGSVLGGMAAIATGSLLLAFVICMAVPLLMGLAKGVFASYVEVPFFIFTIVLASVISDVVLVIMGDETTIYLSNAVKEIPTFSFGQMTAINLIVLVAYFVLCLILFNFTGLGVHSKMIGGNPTAAKQSGINIPKTKTLGFIISAIGIGLAAFLLLIRVRTVGSTTAGTTGNDVIIALVLGGMPVSGGPRSKISAGLVGAATITILNSGLSIMGLSPGIIQFVRGIVFVVVVLVASFSYRTKLLPR